MENTIVVGMGEALWDVLPEGKKIGGAPANFAYHVSQFGLNSRVVSAVGDDKLGMEILDNFREKKLNAMVEIVPYPTGTVQVELDAEGVPCYDIKEGVAWDNIPYTPALEDLAKHTKAVCFGSLAQRSVVFKKKSYELIRDLFIFCCFSGLSWRDMYNLTTDNLQTSFDGHLWIKTNRQKTGTETNIRLLDTAKHIIEKYQGLAEGNKLLPVPCYANCRHGIKAVAKLCGIQKNVCWHQSRHSYATTICLSNGVPIETLSKLMGHTSIRSTQIYAKITAEKVSNDIENLSKQIESLESFICKAI